ncbi:hypothetical protein [Sulfobacillus thermosulfidooxidans]|uniref:hypothetical protein n=1 Tax=Sulfobacillus thermosulfidooxidans TaxID=28034 RepID=UPI000A9B94FA|nr:hypothetical protein [Sulfobacillus thermosulfidooxidans]
MERIIINGQEWCPHSEQNFKTQAAFINARPLTINSVGNWSPYRQVTLYFTHAPEGLNGHAWRTDVDVDVERYTNFGAVLFGVAEIQNGCFSWSGIYPAFVRSKRVYVVLAIADDRSYGKTICIYVDGSAYWRRSPRCLITFSPGKVSEYRASPSDTINPCVA